MARQHVHSSAIDAYTRSCNVRDLTEGSVQPRVLFAVVVFDSLDQARAARLKCAQPREPQFQGSIQMEWQLGYARQGGTRDWKVSKDRLCFLNVQAPSDAAAINSVRTLVAKTLMPGSDTAISVAATSEEYSANTKQAVPRTSSLYTSPCMVSLKQNISSKPYMVTLTLTFLEVDRSLYTPWDRASPVKPAMVLGTAHTLVTAHWAVLLSGLTPISCSTTPSYRR